MQKRPVSHAKRFQLLALSVMLFAALLLSGCQSSATTAPASTPVTEPQVTTQTVAPVEDSGFPVEIVDATGATVVIEQAPQAIIATTVWAGEIILDLVDPSRIKALSAWGDDPVLSATADKAAAIADRVDISTPETIVALMPDLVIIDTFSDPEGALTKTLSEARIPVLQLASPVDFAMIAETIETLALATGDVARGETLIADMNQTLESVTTAVAAVPADKRVKVMYYEDYYDATGNSANMLCAYGVGSPFDAIAKAAQVVNVCDAPNYSPVAKEKVVGDWKPDLLVIPAMQFDENFQAIDDQGATLKAAIQLDPVLSTLPAVKNDQILAIPDRYRGSTSHYMALAVRQLAAAAYPDLVR